VSDTDSYDRNNSQLHPTKECTSGVNQWTRQTWVPQTTTQIDVLTVTMLLLHTPPGASAWWQHTGITNTNIQLFTGNKTGTWQNMAPHIYKDSTPNTVYTLYFLQQLSCWWRPICTMNSTWRQPSPVPDITESEIFIFLAIIIQMKHYSWDRQKHYWLWLNFLTPFDSKTMTSDRLLHIPW